MSVPNPTELSISSRRDTLLVQGVAAAPLRGNMDQRQQFWNRTMKWAFNPRGRGPDVIRTLFLVNPLFMLPMTVILGGLAEHFWRRYFYALLIGESVSLTCYALVTAVGVVGFKILKTTVQRRTFIMASLAGMLPGLWLGFSVAGRAARALGHEWETPTFHDYGLGITIGTLIFSVIILLDVWSASKIRTQQLENETLQAKLSALSAQMNPHLLFNALNTIASTISSDPHAAEETTLRLSELYRGILNSSKRSTHSLLSELDICRAYLGVESARFAERLKWSINAEPGLDAIEVPTLLVQPLVENAIKHGIAQRATGGNIWVRISRADSFLQIVVEDDGVGIGNSAAKTGTGTGVSSCRSRLELTYGTQASFEIGPRSAGTGARVQIKIPEKVTAAT